MDILTIVDNKQKDYNTKMNQNFLKNELADIVGADNVRENVELSGYTSFKIGGPCRLMIEPGSPFEVREVVQLLKAREMPFVVIGKGSNLLVSDRGYEGAVILINRNLDKVRTEGTRITAQAGASLSSVALAALADSLTGFEFAAGIPGTIGGACVMNAGAYGGELKDVLVKATVLTPEGEIIQMDRDELELGYRTSVIPAKQLIVLEAEIELTPGDGAAIKARMNELRDQRISKQPLNYPSAGSTFKRPEGYFAGKLIQDAGLKGYSVGGAEVSVKHSGFVVNKGGATASDVYKLINNVIELVRQDSGVTLEPEVKFLGEF